MTLCLGAQNVVEVDRHTPLIPLHEHFEILRDPDRSVEIDAIHRGDVSARFTNVDTGNDFLGFTRDDIWLRVSLRSTDSERTNWFVELAHSRFEWIDWYVLKDGKITARVASGNQRPPSGKLAKSRFPTLPLTIEAGEMLELVLHLRTQSRIRMPLNLYSAPAYAARDKTPDMIYLCCFGAILALFAAGLIFGLAVDFKGALYYSASILSTGLYHFGLSGYWEMLEFPGWQFGTRQGGLCLYHLASLTLLLYLDSFFCLRENNPALSKAVRRIAFAGALVLPGIAFLPYWPTIVFVEAELALFGVFAILTAIRCARRGNRIARFYLLAWTGFWAASSLVVFYWVREVPDLFDPLPHAFLTTNVSLVIFLLCMADRARLQRFEKEIAQKEFSDLQSQTNEKLERQVAERTVSLNEAKEQAERANHYKEMFLANISHEIRTPLSALISLSQVMHSQSEQCRLPPDFTRMLEQIRSGGKHLNLMLTNLLDASTANFGKATLRLDPFKLDQWSQIVRDILEPIATAKRLTLIWRDEALAGRVLVSDQMRLSQILINLVDNAVKFTESGTVEVIFVIAGPSFSFEIRDEGPGLPAPVEVLYEAFEQSLPVEADPTHGVGLGLYVVQSNVRLLEGEIFTAAREKRGTVFRVEFKNAFRERETSLIIP